MWVARTAAWAALSMVRGAVVVALILAILLGAFLLEKGRRRRGIAGFSLWSTLGFAAYYIFIGFTMCMCSRKLPK